MQSTTVLWLSVALIYLILMLQNFRWLYRIKKIESEEKAGFHIKPDGVSVGTIPGEEESVKVTGMFASILKTDTVGFILAIAAAAITAL